MSVMRCSSSPVYSFAIDASLFGIRPAFYMEITWYDISRATSASMARSARSRRRPGFTDRAQVGSPLCSFAHERRSPTESTRFVDEAMFERSSKASSYSFSCRMGCRRDQFFVTGRRRVKRVVCHRVDSKFPYR